MKIIIIDDYAHRLLNNGLVESAEVTIAKDGRVCIQEKTWGIRDPNNMRFTGAEYYSIKTMLQRLHEWFPENRLPVPSSTPETPVPQSAGEPRL